MYETTTSIWDRPGDDGGPSLEQLDRSITELAAHIDAATHRLLVLIAEFDRRQGWALGGFLSCAHFLNVRIGLGIVAAREKVRVARALESLPAISQAMARGEISYSKVRAMTRIATPENEAELLTMARSGPASHVERVVREYRRVGRAGLQQAQRQQEGRYLNAFYDDSGMLVVEGRLPPEVGAVVLAALEGAQRAVDASAESSGDRTERPGQRRADALSLLAERALPALGMAGRGEPYQVVVHVDAAVLADAEEDGECCLENGPAIAGETARRLSCDAPVVSMVHGPDGAPLSVGRKSRRVSTALHRALRARDRTCVFPGCTRTGREVHHVTHWADGGATDPENLALLCPAHHAAVHEGGVTLEGRAPDGLVFRTAAGYPITGRPAAPALPEDPVATLLQQNRDEGLDIGPATSRISWWGERLDAGLAVSNLLRHGAGASA